MMIGVERDQTKTKLGTITYLTSQYTGEPRWSLSKSGNIVTGAFLGRLVSGISGQGAIVATLPEGFRPIGHSVELSGFTTYGSSSGMFWFSLNTNGNIISSTGTNTMSGQVMIQFAFAI